MFNLILRYLAALISVGFFFCNGYSQNNKNVLNGLVFDASTKEPIPGVNILISNTGNGTTTNKNGEFTLFIAKMPVKIVISHISYLSDTLYLKNKQDQSQITPKDTVTFFLRKNMFIIEGVTVVAGVQQIFSQEPYAIVDYELTKMHIIAIGYKNHNEFKKEVLLSDMNGNVKWSRSMPKITALHKDCLDQVYLISKDSVYSCHVVDNRLTISDSVDVNFFYDFIEPIKVVTDSWTIFSKSPVGRQYITYFLLKKNSSSAELVYQTGDRIKEGRLDALNRQTSQVFREVVKAEDSGQLNALYYMGFKNLLVKQTEYRPVYSEVVFKNDSVRIFDFDKLMIITFPKDFNQYRMVPINVIFNADWNDRMHYDPIDGRYFLEFRNGSFTYLIEINPYTGEELRQIPIPGFNHIDEIQARGSKLYFLQQPDLSNGAKKLFVVNI